MAYAGDDDAAESINEVAAAALASSDAVLHVKNHCNSSAVNGWYVDSVPPKFDVLTMAPMIKEPILVQLLSSVGGHNHAVTVKDDVIFDANFKHGMKLTKENLDRCIPGEATFDKHARAFVLRCAFHTHARTAHRAFPR